MGTAIGDRGTVTMVHCGHITKEILSQAIIIVRTVLDLLKSLITTSMCTLQLYAVNTTTSRHACNLLRSYYFIKYVLSCCAGKFLFNITIYSTTYIPGVYKYKAQNNFFMRPVSSLLES